MEICGDGKVRKELPARKRPSYRSVVALAEPLGNAGHDQMNQQRQLIARQGPWEGTSGRRRPREARVRTNRSIYMYAEHTFRESSEKGRGAIVS